MVELDHPAKNVIFFMGDGMGVSTLTAARVYLAQSRGIVGEEAILSWETFPYTAMSRVHCFYLTSPSTNDNKLCRCILFSTYVELN